MPITRVELSAQRLRHRRDNRQLRVSTREVRYHDGDTLANAIGETRVGPSSGPVSELVPEPTSTAPDGLLSDAATASDNADPGMRASANPESRLCDLKAVLSGNSVESDSSSSMRNEPLVNRVSTADPPTDAATNTPIPVDEAFNAKVAPATAVRRNASAERRRTSREKRYGQLPVISSGEPLDPQVGQSRLDLITGEWTWFATMRSQRPDQFGNMVVKPTLEINCPFCAGEEHRTPDPVWVAKVDDIDAAGVASNLDGKSTLGNIVPCPDWSVRVVPNLYPAVTRLEDADVQTPECPTESEPHVEKEAMPASARRHRASGSNANFRTAGSIDFQHRALRGTTPAGMLFPCEPAMGGHEVIIEAPRHTESLGELNTAEISLVFAAYAARIRHWRSVPGVRHVAIFKNVGRDAGASLQHSHSQLIATNRVPALVQHVTRRLQAHHARVGSCLQCDLIRGEIAQKSRLVSQTDSFVAYCPFASRFPLQVRLTSKEHLPCISELRPAPLSELARLTLRVVRWLEALRPSTAYNVLVHTCPVDFEGAKESQHWAMDIFPRVSRLAGFELATGAMINPIYPETAAKAYRAQARACDPRYVLR